MKTEILCFVCIFVIGFVFGVCCMEVFDEIDYEQSLQEIYEINREREARKWTH
ncbi:MAG: hypothetical protein ACO23H_03115 [Alphaproteobacteria bacterium]